MVMVFPLCSCMSLAGMYWAGSSATSAKGFVLVKFIISICSYRSSMGSSDKSGSSKPKVKGSWNMVCTSGASMVALFCRKLASQKKSK